MRTLWAALLVVGVAGMGAGAETSQQRGKRVVDEALAALGGQAYLNMQNRVETGRIYSSYNDKVSGMAVDALYTTYLSRPEPGFLGVRVRDARGRKPEDIILKKQDDIILYTDCLLYTSDVYKRQRGDRVFARRKAVGTILAVGVRRSDCRFRASDGHCYIREAIGIVAAKFVGPAALYVAEDRCARGRLGKTFNPLNILIVRPVSHFMSAGAVTCTQIAI